MGMIRIETWGSFPETSKTLGPANNGHADLVAEVIEYLASEAMTHHHLKGGRYGY